MSKLDERHVWGFEVCLNPVSLIIGGTEQTENLYKCRLCGAGIIGPNLELAVEKAESILPPFSCFDIMVSHIHQT